MAEVLSNDYSLRDNRISGIARMHVIFSDPSQREFAPYKCIVSRRKCRMKSLSQDLKNLVESGNRIFSDSIFLGARIGSVRIVIARNLHDGLRAFLPN